MLRRPAPSDHPSDPQSAQDPTGGHDRLGPAHAARGARSAQRSLPWGAVVAGAGAVTLVVAAAGMVGAATGGPPAVVVPGATSGGQHGGEPGSPVVIPRADEPRPTVTRIPPREDGDDPAAPQERRGGGTAPSAPSDEPSPGDVVAQPAPQQPADETPEPGAGPSPSPTTSPTREPAPTAEPGTVDARWVQQRLRAHGATVELTGQLDEATVAALKAFQTSAGLAAGGTVDAATREALAAEPAPETGAGGGGGGRPGGDPTPAPTGTAPPTLGPSGTGMSGTTPSAPVPSESSAAG